MRRAYSAYRWHALIAVEPAVIGHESAQVIRPITCAVFVVAPSETMLSIASQPNQRVGRSAAPIQTKGRR